MIIIVLSYIISQDISCSLVTEVSGTDNKVKTQNNYEFLSFDNRKSKHGTSCDTTKFEKLRSKYENAEAAKKPETTESKGHVPDGNQGAVQAPNVTTLKPLPPFVYA